LKNATFSGRVVWVTGASSGIGEALCHAFSKSGARLVLSARREDMLENVRAACQRPDDHLVLPLDLLNADSFPTAVERVLKRFGHIDVLVNGAGMSQRGTALETQLSVDRQLMDLNYFGPVALTKQVLPSMIARRSGHIVVISSLLGKFSVPGRAAYCGSKHAIHGFFNALRAEIYSQNISVTIVCPGFIRTNASMNALKGDGTPHAQMDHDIDQGLSPQECARQMMHAIAKRRSEVYIAGKERFAVLVSRLTPRLFNRLARSKKLK
jgi:dehydrogenase/reductase SDR family member 7B